MGKRFSLAPLPRMLTMKKIVSQFLKGTLIGAANAVPGVSGGTIAVITGIYDRLLNAVSQFKTGGEGSVKKNILFLLPILLGVGIGLLLFSKVLVWTRSFIPMPTGFLFLGLIVGSFPYLFKIASKNGFRFTNLIPFTLAFVGLLVMVLTDRSPETPPLRSLEGLQYLWFFIAAVVGMGAMVVPGISGSFVLLLLGAYSTFITSIAEVNIPLLGVFGAGSLVGLLLISKALTWLLKTYHDSTYWGILGLVTGSLVDLLLRAVETNSWSLSQQYLDGWLWPVTFVFFGLGLFGALFLSGEKKEKNQGMPQ